MSEFVLLLRGINVGGKNSLPMQVLKKILLELGYTNISTYIQSGNVVCSTTEKHEKKTVRKISAAIEETVGFSPPVLMLSEPEFQDSFQKNPFPEISDKTLHFFFLEETPIAPDLPRLDELKTGSEECQLIGKTLYLHAPDGIGRSKLAAGIEKAMGVNVTARNWNTVQKLSDMLSDLS